MVNNFRAFVSNLIIIINIIMTVKTLNAIWIPIQPAWGVERSPAGPKANNSIASTRNSDH